VQDEPETETTTGPTVKDGARRDSARSSTAKRVDYDLQGPAKALMDRCVKDAESNTARLDRDRQDWLNLLFDRGGPDNQYVIWDAGANRWVTRGTDPKKGGLPEWMPRPVTNLFANKLDGVISILNQSDPAQLWKPNTDDDEDLATADICDDAVPVLREEIDYAQLRTDINRQIALTDKVALILYYDNDEQYGTQDINALQCTNPNCAEYALPMDLEDQEPEASALGADAEFTDAGMAGVMGTETGPTCPECGSPMTEAVDPRTGGPIGVTYPVGKMCASFHASFEFSLPRSARSHRADKNPWILFHTRYAWEEAIKEFPKFKDQLKDRTGWKSSGVQRHYADAMRRLSSPRSSAQSGVAGGQRQDDGPVIYRLYHDPINDDEFSFPQGLYAVMLNDQLVEAGPLSFKYTLPTGQDRYFKNVITRTFRPTPGNPHGKPPADDMVSLQYTRNLLEALLMAILLHHASPRTYLPLSVTLEKAPTGTPGEVIPFRSTTPGEVPITTQGMNPPEGLYKWIAQVDEKFDVLSKLNAVLQGERPKGDPTLGEIQILREQGQSAFAEVLLESVRFERQLSRMLLWIARDTVWTDRLRQVAGDNRGWEISEFNAADLSGNVDVEIDPATAWPKSSLMEKLQLQELMKMGVFQMLSQNPELATKILEKYGATDFLPSLDRDRRQVMRELDRWRAATDPSAITPPNPIKHNPAMHLLHKLAFLRTEEFEELEQANPPLAQAMLAHVQQLQQMVSAGQSPKAEPPKMSFSVSGDLADPDARRLFEQVNGLPPTPAPPDPKAGSDGSALEGAIQSGALQPASAATAGGLSLDAAVQQGLLKPAGAADAQAQAAGPSIDDLTAQGVLTPAAAVQPPGSTPGLPGEMPYA
jgi:hypothetical protein